MQQNINISIYPVCPLFWSRVSPLLEQCCWRATHATKRQFQNIVSVIYHWIFSARGRIPAEAGADLRSVVWINKGSVTELPGLARRRMLGGTKGLERNPDNSHGGYVHSRFHCQRKCFGQTKTGETSWYAIETNKPFSPAPSPQNINFLGS